MKKYILSILITINLLNASGIPVVDGVANAQSMAQNIKTIEEWAREAERWADTASHYKNQLQAYENELLSKTGVRDSVNFLKDLNKLSDYSKMYGEDFLNITGTNSSYLGKMSEQLFDKYNIYDRCKNLKREWEITNCKNVLKREVNNIATVQATNNMINKSSQNLESLGKNVSASKDIKESQDLANAINIEIGNIQVAQMKLDMMYKQNEALKKAEEEQHTRDFYNRLGKSVKLIN